MSVFLIITESELLVVSEDASMNPSNGQHLSADLQIDEWDIVRISEMNLCFFPQSFGAG